MRTLVVLCALTLTFTVQTEQVGSKNSVDAKASGQENTPAASSRCTPPPDLRANWKVVTLGRDATDGQLKPYAERERSRVRSLPDPFSPLAKDISLRERNRERVLWENDVIFVLVAKPDSSRELLVIPKTQMNFIIDAPEGLAKQLAKVAAATSDSFIFVAGKHCEPENYSQVFINPPSALAVAQLHIHVQPPLGLLGSKNEAEIYPGVSKYLGEWFVSGIEAKEKRH